MKYRLFGALAGLLASTVALAAPSYQMAPQLGTASVKTEAAGTQHTQQNPAVFDAKVEQSMQQKAIDGHIDLAANNPDQSLLAPLPVMDKMIGVDNTLAPPFGQQFVAIDRSACTTTIGHQPAFTQGRIDGSMALDKAKTPDSLTFTGHITAPASESKFTVPWAHTVVGAIPNLLGGAPATIRVINNT